MNLDPEPLQNACQRLEEGLAILAAAPHDSMLRDAVIKRFEFTYEITHRTLRRFLTESAAEPDTVAAMSFPELIRTGSERGLLRSDWKRWHVFRDARNKTSHLYDQRAADAVLSEVPDFLAEALHFSARLKAELTRDNESSS